MKLIGLDMQLCQLTFRLVHGSHTNMETRHKFSAAVSVSWTVCHPCCLSGCIWVDTA